MSKNRKAAEKYILESIQSLTPKSTKNRELYESRFKDMSDAEFDRFMKRLESGDEILMIIIPPNSNDGCTVENNLKIADKIGHSFFTKIMVVGQEGVPDHLTPIQHMVMDLPVKRLAQTSEKKIKVPKSNKVIDSLTGQVTGESKGAAISGPELQVLTAMGLEAPVIEVMKYRGGDLKGRQAFNGLIQKQGQASLKTLSNYASGVESTASLRTFMTAAMLRNNL